MPHQVLTNFDSDRHQLFGVCANDLLHNVRQIVVFGFSDYIQKLERYLLNQRLDVLLRLGLRSENRLNAYGRFHFDREILIGEQSVRR